MRLRTKILICALPLLVGGCALFKKDPPPNKLTPDEAMNGWNLLWNGETTDGWVGMAAGCSNFTAKGWVADTNGMLRAESGASDPIRTAATFRDFDLKFDYRLAPGAEAAVRCFHVAETNVDLSMEFPLTELPPPAKSNEWISARITARRKFVSSWLNGARQPTRTRETGDVGGRIVLQPRKGQVEFRNLRIWTFNLKH